MAGHTRRKLPCCNRRSAQWWGDPSILGLWSEWLLVCACGAVFNERDVEVWTPTAW